MKLILLFVCVLGMLFTPGIQAKAYSEYDISWGADSSELSLQDKISIACQAMGCDSALVTFVAKCESTNRMVWDATGRYYGIFQYVPSTFDAYSYSAFHSLLGDDDVDRNKISIYNLDHQILTTTWAFANGKQKAWGCYFKY